jgi:hypothetical protein
MTVTVGLAADVAAPYDVRHAVITGNS